MNTESNNGKHGASHEVSPREPLGSNARENPTQTAQSSVGGSGGGWRTAALIAAVALGTFSFGHFWGRESASRRDGAAAVGRSEAGKGEPSAKADSGGGSVSAASDQPTGKQLWTCSMHPQVIQDKPGLCPICHMELTPIKASASGGSGVSVDPIVVQNMGVRTATIAKGPLVQSIRVVGYLEEPAPLHRDVNLRVNGWIEKLYANVDGMMIEKGKPLFDLYSPELTVAIDEYISAQQQVDAGSSDATSKTIVDASRRKLLQYGLEESQVEGFAKLETAPRTVPILASMGGHLTAKMVYEGAAVKAGDLVLRLADRHYMWIDAQVYEQQMPLIKSGQAVRASIVALPGKTFDGKVLFIHPHLDPATRTALVRIEIPNQDLYLRQGMYATVEVLADEVKDSLVLPREAVIDTGRKQIAFISLGEGKFEPRELKLGLPGQNGTVQVLSGVKDGEQVVTSGQFLLDSESRLREALAKFGSSSSPTANERSSNPGSTESEATSAMTGSNLPMAAEVTPVAVPHTDEILKAYLSIAKSLGARQESDAPIDVKPLLDVTTMAAGHTSGEAKPLVVAVSDAAAAMSGKPIGEQRRAFMTVSDAVIAMVRRSKPSQAAAPSLFLLNCPMAFGNEKGANWIQDEEAVANPYYATSMKSCGSVVERLQVSK